MRKNGARAIAALVLSSACDPAVRTASFVEPATSRPYVMLSRDGHDLRLPSAALFVLHPYGTDPSVLVRKFGLDRRAAGRRGWLVIVPQGTTDAAGRLSWNASAACCGAGRARPDDPAYLRAVLRDVRRRAAVDPGRVYAIGESNGGFLAHRWACGESGDLRAIVSIAGAAPGPEDPPCAPPHPVSALQIHGDRDEMVRYEGGRTARGTYPSARETVGLWRALDGCDPVPRRSHEAQLFFFAPMEVESFSCPAGARVALWTVAGGGHRLGTVRRWSDAMIEFLEPEADALRRGR